MGGDHLLDGLECPDWFWDRSLSTLVLTPGMRKALRECEIVGDLRKVPVAELLSLPSMGPKRIRRIREVVSDAYAVLASTPRARDDAGCPPEAPYDLSSPLFGHLSASLRFLEEGEAAVLSRRLGLDGPASTFGDIAASEGYSGTRAGQVFANAVRRLDAATGCFGAVRARLAEVSATGVIKASDLELQAWTAGMPIPQLHAFVADFAGLHPIVMPWGERLFMPFAPLEWRVHAATVRDALASVGMDCPSGAGVVALRERFDAATRVGAAVLEVVEPLLARGGVMGAMLALGFRREAAVALMPAEGGFRFADIGARFEREQGYALDTVTLREWLADVSLHLGGDMHVRRVPPAGWADAARRCLEVARAGTPGRIWETGELLHALAGTWDGDEIGLELALSQAAGLRRVHPFRWRAVADGPVLSLHAIAVSVLEANGKPMPTGELRKAVAGIWGSTRCAQLAPAGRLVNLGGRVWGLADRDIRTADSPDAVIAYAMSAFADGETSVAAIYEGMSSRGEADGLDGPDALAALIKARTGIGRGRDGHLKDPRDPASYREGSKMWAVVDVFSRATGGLTKPELVALVRSTTGTAVNLNYVSNILSKWGYPGTEGRWYPRPVAGDAREGDAARPEKRSYPARRRPAAAKRKTSHWEPADLATLETMWAGGSTALEISVALGGTVSRSAVLSKIHRLGIGRSKGDA